jgi:hypothetical protein
MRRLFVSLVLIGVCLICQGQTVEKISFQLPNNNINIEFLGNVFILGSVNYERVFFHQNKIYLTGRWGLGYFEDVDIVKIWSTPILVNFIYNCNQVLSFEIGTGTTVFMQFSNEEYEDGIDPVITGFAGIRLHRIRKFKGFTFRIGFTPIYNFQHTYWFSPKTFTPWGGFSFGYSFGKD